MVVLDDFEDGDMSGWTVPGTITAETSPVYEGSYSCGTNESGESSTYLHAYRSFQQSDGFTIYWQEDSGSYGGGYQLLNSNGNRVCGFGTSNPGWIVTDGSYGEQIYSGDGYDRWIEVQVTYDGGNGVTYRFEDLQSGHVENVSRNTDTNDYFAEVQFVNIGGASDLSSESIGSSSYNHWQDYVLYEPIQLAPSAPSNLTASPSGNDINLSWDASDWNGDTGHYNLYRNGSLYDGDIGSGTTYTDSNLEDGEFYDYYVTATNSGGTSGASNTDGATTALPAPSNLTLNEI